jgi:hypothetical protein
MTRDWEGVFSTWAQGPGATEQQRSDNAVRAIRSAVDASTKLNHRSIQVFLQGSYRNHTNVRQESDVDVGVLCSDTFFHELPEGYTREHFGLEPASYTFAQFKNEIEEALVSHFGRRSVTRGNKAFDIRETGIEISSKVMSSFSMLGWRREGSPHDGEWVSPLATILLLRCQSASTST